MKIPKGLVLVSTALVLACLVACPAPEPEPKDSGTPDASLPDAFVPVDSGPLADTWTPDTSVPNPWGPQTVDTNTGLWPSLAMDGTDRPHISYINESTNELKYSTWNGSAWDTQVVADGTSLGEHSSLALTASGQPYISYTKSSILKLAHWTGSDWEIETVGFAVWVKDYSDLVLDSSDHPRLCYYDENDRGIVYSRYNGSAWETSTVDSASGTVLDGGEAEDSVGEVCSLVLDSAGNPHVAYTRAFSGGGLLARYAVLDGSDWQYTTVDAAQTAGDFVALGLVNAAPVVFYYEPGHSRLRQALMVANDFAISTVRGVGEWGSFPSLVVHGADHRHLTFRDSDTNQLHYFHGTTGWEEDVIDLGWYCSIALDNSGNPHVAYREHYSEELKYAHK